MEDAKNAGDHDHDRDRDRDHDSQIMRAKVLRKLKLVYKA
jgi:hypothetical protein